jgi:hypothetical protein
MFTTPQRSDPRRPLLCLLTVAAMLALTACGSSSDTAFVSRADAVCARAVAQHDKATFPVAHFDPLHPRAQDLPAVADYLATYGEAGKTLAQLDALGTPKKHAGDWSRLRGVLAKVVDNADQQVGAARRSDTADFERLVRDTRTLGSQVDGDATKVGFDASSPCRKIFG